MKSIFFGLFLALGLTLQAATLAPTDSTGTTSRHGMEYIIHQVEGGETLTKIAKKYKISVDAIQKENTNTQTLAIGQKLFIPTGKKAQKSTGATVHTVSKGEGLYGLSKKYGVTVEDIQKWNNLSSTAISLGQKLIVSAPVANKPAKQLPTASQKVTHTVAKGEGLYGISKKYGVTVEDIQRLNGLEGTNLNLGQVLVIKEGTSAPKQAPRKQEDTAAATPDVNHPKQLESAIPLGSNNRQEETGLVGFAALAQYNSKFSYGLHKTAPVGTVVKVVNEEGKVHWVRIMGTLDAASEEVLKVNKTVLEKIGSGNTSFKATISYVL